MMLTSFVLPILAGGLAVASPVEQANSPQPHAAVEPSIYPSAFFFDDTCSSQLHKSKEGYIKAIWMCQNAIRSAAKAIENSTYTENENGKYYFGELDESSRGKLHKLYSETMLGLFNGLQLIGKNKPWPEGQTRAWCASGDQCKDSKRLFSLENFGKKNASIRICPKAVKAGAGKHQCDRYGAGVGLLGWSARVAWAKFVKENGEQGGLVFKYKWVSLKNFAVRAFNDCVGPNGLTHLDKGAIAAPLAAARARAKAKVMAEALAKVKAEAEALAKAAVVKPKADIETTFSYDYSCSETQRVQMEEVFNKCKNLTNDAYKAVTNPFYTEYYKKIWSRAIEHEVLSVYMLMDSKCADPARLGKKNQVECVESCKAEEDIKITKQGMQVCSSALARPAQEGEKLNSVAARLLNLAAVAEVGNPSELKYVDAEQITRFAVETYRRPTKPYRRPTETYRRPTKTYPRPTEPPVDLDIHYRSSCAQDQREQFEEALRTCRDIFSKDISASALGSHVDAQKELDDVYGPQAKLSDFFPRISQFCDNMQSVNRGQSDHAKDVIVYCVANDRCGNQPRVLTWNTSPIYVLHVCPAEKTSKKCSAQYNELMSWITYNVVSGYDNQKSIISGALSEIAKKACVENMKD